MLSSILLVAWIGGISIVELNRNPDSWICLIIIGLYFLAASVVVLMATAQMASCFDFLEISARIPVGSNTSIGPVVRVDREGTVTAGLSLVYGDETKATKVNHTGGFFVQPAIGFTPQGH